jgi:hypothetical protein
MMLPEEESKLLLANRTSVDLCVWLPGRRHDIADSAVRVAVPTRRRWKGCECHAAGGVSTLVAVESWRGAQVDGGVPGSAGGYVRIVAAFLCGSQATLAVRGVVAKDGRSRQSR